MTTLPSSLSWVESSQFPLQLECDIHPVTIIPAYNKALQAVLDNVSRISIPIDTSDNAQIPANRKIDWDPVCHPPGGPHVSLSR